MVQEYLTKKCAANIDGFCNEFSEFYIENCKYRGNHGRCTATEDVLVEVDEECFHCDGSPEFEDDQILCPVEFPEQCPFNLYHVPQIKVYRYDEPWDCHGHGPVQVESPTLIQIPNLCQHQVSLCDDCLYDLIKKLLIYIGKPKTKKLLGEVGFRW